MIDLKDICELNAAAVQDRCIARLLSVVHPEIASKARVPRIQKRTLNVYVCISGFAMSHLPGMISTSPSPSLDALT